MGYSPWGRKESDNRVTSLHFASRGLGSHSHLQGGWQARRDGSKLVPVQPQVQQAAQGLEGQGGYVSVM